MRGGLDLIHDLEVDRHAGLEIDLEYHSWLSVIGQYDRWLVAVKWKFWGLRGLNYHDIRKMKRFADVGRSTKAGMALPRSRKPLGMINLTKPARAEADWYRFPVRKRKMEIPDKSSASDLAPQPTPALSRLRLYVLSLRGRALYSCPRIEDSPAVRLAPKKIARWNGLL